MQSQHNTTNYLLLLQQQIHLQHDFEKYLKIEENILLSLKDMKHVDHAFVITSIENISMNLGLIIGALEDATTHNNGIIKEFRECIHLISNLQNSNGN